MSRQFLSDDDPMPFGKYRGTAMANVPASYLDWLSGQDWIKQWKGVWDYIKRNREAINNGLAENDEDMREIFEDPEERNR